MLSGEILFLCSQDTKGQSDLLTAAVLGVCYPKYSVHKIGMFSHGRIPNSSKMFHPPFSVPGAAEWLGRELTVMSPGPPSFTSPSTWSMPCWLFQSSGEGDPERCHLTHIV